jgi:hypothetical protein
MIFVSTPVKDPSFTWVSLLLLEGLGFPSVCSTRAPGPGLSAVFCLHFLWLFFNFFSIWFCHQVKISIVCRFLAGWSWSCSWTIGSKAQVFIILLVFRSVFLLRTWDVWWNVGETVRLILIVGILLVTLCASSFVFHCDFWFLTRFWGKIASNSYMVLVELKESRVGSSLWHRSSFVKNFDWLSFTRPLVIFSGLSIGIRASLVTCLL